MTLFDSNIHYLIYVVLSAAIILFGFAIWNANKPCPFKAGDIVHMQHPQDTFEGEYQVSSIDTEGNLLLKKLGEDSFSINVKWDFYRAKLTLKS